MDERSSIPILDRDRCTNCGDCIPACAPGVFGLVAGRLEFLRPDLCDYCGRCEEACDEEAISCPYDIVPDVRI